MRSGAGCSFKEQDDIKSLSRHAERAAPCVCVCVSPPTVPTTAYFWRGAHSAELMTDPLIYYQKQ